MFAYCRNNPVCRKDISGTTEVALVDDNTDLLDEKKTFEGGHMGNSDANGGGVKSGKLNFKSESALNEHYYKHNPEFGNAFSSPQEYADAANYVINSGEYIGSQNAYVKFYGINGTATYAFVGLSYNHAFITTFHLKHASQIQF